MSSAVSGERNHYMPFFLGACYGLGVLHWVFMFSKPHGPGLARCEGVDWTLAANYYDILRSAVREWRFPWLMDFAHYSNRFLGLPETPLSPQYALVLLMPYSAFNLLNVLFLFTCSFLGLVLLQREHGLSPLPFFFLFLLYSFNGYLVSRVSAGHFMWFGYFFMPYIHWALLRLVDGNGGVRIRLFLALGFFALLLEGSFHLFVWWTIYLGILAVLHPKLIRPVAEVLIVGLGLGLFRLLPCAVSLWNTGLHFTAGYSGLAGLLDALTGLRPAEWSDTDGAFGYMHWWEFDCYIGLAGFLLLGCFSLVRAFGGDARGSYRALDFASLAMALLCFGDLLGALGLLPVPFFSSQRVASRLIIVPLTTCVVLGSIRMEQLLRARPKDLSLRLLLSLLLGTTVYELYRHTSAWKVTRMDEFFDGSALYPKGASLVNPDWSQPGMGLYAGSVAVGMVVSLGVLAGVAVALWRTKGRNSAVPVALPPDCG